MESGRGLPHRPYRAVFTAAGLYNLAFGAWAGAAPHHFFELFGLDAPRYPQIWHCLGMVLGLYGLLYLHAARRLDHAWPIIAVGLAGKVLGPLGWVGSVLTTDWSPASWPLIVCNDLIWWIPFGAFVWSRRPGRGAT